MRSGIGHCFVGMNNATSGMTEHMGGFFLSNWNGVNTYNTHNGSHAVNTDSGHGWGIYGAGGSTTAIGSTLSGLFYSEPTLTPVPYARLGSPIIETSIRNWMGVT